VAVQLNTAATKSVHRRMQLKFLGIMIGLIESLFHIDGNGAHMELSRFEGLKKTRRAMKECGRVQAKD